MYPSGMTFPGALVFPGVPGVLEIGQAIALGVGANGALVDVTAYVTGPEGVSYGWGRQNEFRDPNPGQFTFVLDNYDGRFTPGNASSPLATLLTEGTAACWKFNGRLVAGLVSAIGMAASEEQWGRVTITVGDVFYVANRTTLLQGLAPSMGAQQCYLYWPLNDAAASAGGAEYNNGPTIAPLNRAGITTYTAPTGYAFGVAGPAMDTQLQVTQAATGQGTFSTEAGFQPSNATPTNLPAVVYPAGSAGTWGFWYTPADTNAQVQLVIANLLGGAVQNPGTFLNLTLHGVTASVTVQGTTIASGVTISNSTLPIYISVSITYTGSTTFTATLYANGVQVATGTAVYGSGFSAAQLTPAAVRLIFGSGSAASTVAISHLAHTPVALAEWATLPTTIANRLQAVAQTVPSMVLGTIDPNATTAILDTQTGTQVSTWTLLCDLLRTEQGHLYTTTSGSLLSPSTVVNLRSRTRPTTVAQTFDAQLELEGVPQFVRDITNLYSSITAAGPVNSVTVTDRTIAARAGSATASESVALQSPADLRMWAQDRLVRGENVALQLISITIDAKTTPTSRYADLLGLVPGDRIQITNIPPAALGFTSWDGWFLGASEVHNYQSDAFTLYLAPVMTAPAIYDTDHYSAGTDLSLSTSLTVAATSMVVTTASTLTFLETVQVPYTLQIDAEQVTVTACTALSGGTQTATITRGASGTTAAAHAAGALVDIPNPGIYAY